MLVGCVLVFASGLVFVGVIAFVGCLDWAFWASEVRDWFVFAEDGTNEPHGTSLAPCKLAGFGIG